ncbi:helix-turn-helix domain-containing protein [Massiliimalia massiliensis]|uniref:helix-turn-helix domain-containing protein n=1 Tax=Massiliimalia massiliensis TaxID=1852384 RepID=UPI00098570A4|nr:helix-turn-helix transcriptional regulator [Massiliimalia massiliensis]MBS1473974.1 helix-turn-helix transcriptional regulator [Massiliimalia sp.]
MAENQKSTVKFTINPKTVLFHLTKLSYFRKRHHLKRTELSKLTGISVNALQLWELGQAKPHYSYWRKLDLFMREYEENGGGK